MTKNVFLLISNLIRMLIIANLKYTVYKKLTIHNYKIKYVLKLIQIIFKLMKNKIKNPLSN